MTYKYGDEKSFDGRLLKFLPSAKDSIFEDENKYLSDYKKYGWKIISPVFKTEDGKDIFEDDTIFRCYEGLIYDEKVTTDNYFVFYPERYLKYFSSKELAMLDYLETYGFFSIKDVLGEVAMALKNGSLDISELYKSLLKLAKNK